MSEFDVQLMAETSERMECTIAADLASLEKSHGAPFAGSVAANIGIQLLTTAIAAPKTNEQRVVTAVAIMASLSQNLRLALAAEEADSIIAKAMGKGAAC